MLTTNVPAESNVAEPVQVAGTEGGERKTEVVGGPVSCSEVKLATRPPSPLRDEAGWLAVFAIIAALNQDGGACAHA